MQLTHIRDLPAANNVDTVRLSDILGDPMIRECWQFNYLFDVDFLLSNFDEDVRSLVQVKVVHGSWQKEAPNRVRVEVSLRIGLIYLEIDRGIGSMFAPSQCPAHRGIYARAIRNASFENDDSSSP